MVLSGVCRSMNVTIRWFEWIFCCNDTATTEIYTYVHTLSLHDALPISSTPARRRRSRTRVGSAGAGSASRLRAPWTGGRCASPTGSWATRSEEHTSELQSLMRISYAVFCLKKQKTINRVKHTVQTGYTCAILCRHSHSTNTHT